jgi:hypothetical protein
MVFNVQKHGKFNIRIINVCLYKQTASCRSTSPSHWSACNLAIVLVSIISVLLIFPLWFNNNNWGCWNEQR